MILDEQQERELKSFLVKRLEPISKADPSVLSTYIIALLKRNDKTMQQLKTLCNSELQDFLQEQTAQFVDDLFAILPEMEKTSNIHISIEGEGFERDVKNRREKSPTGADRKRRREDVRSPEERRRKRSPSPKRSRSRSRSRYSHSPSRSRSRSPSDDESRGRKRGRDDDSRFRKERPSEDRSRPGRRGEIPGLGRSGGRDVLPRGRRGGMGGNRRDESYSRQPRRRGMCRDYEEKGICLRGNLCPYDHFSGVQPIVVDEAGLNQLQPNIQQSIPTPDLDEVGSYNPENPFLKTTPIPVWTQQQPLSAGLIPVRGGQLLPLPAQQQLGIPGAGGQYSSILPQPPLNLVQRNMPSDDFRTDLSSGGPMFMSGGAGGNGRGRGRGRGMRGRGGIDSGGVGRRHFEGAGEEGDGGDQGSGGYNQGRGGGYYGGRDQGGYDNQGRPLRRRRFEQKRPTTDSICVARIPAELNSIDQLNSHFKKFGTIVNIQIDQPENRAFVQFSNHMEALKALRAPEAVLGNRFIQVYLKRDEPAEQGAQAPGAPTPAAPVTPVVAQPRPAIPTAVSAPKPRPAVVAPKAPVRKESEQLVQLRKQKEELRKKQLAAQQAILTTLSGMKGKSKEKDELMLQLNQLTQQLAESLQKDKTTLEAAKRAEPAVPAVVPPSSGGWKKSSLESEKDRLDRELELLARAKDKPKAVEPPAEKAVAAVGKEEEEGVDGDVDVGGDAEGGVATATTATETPVDTAAGAEGEESAKERRVKALQAKLSSLKSEAAQLGLDSSPAVAGYSGRGTRARGRGMRIRASARGYWRGARGRGAPRGRGGPEGARSFRLDNRTTVISIKELPDDVRDENLLRAHFQTFGTILSLNLTDDTAQIQFDTRREAEMAMQYGRTLKGKGLDMSWFDKLRTPAEGVEQPLAGSEEQGEAGEAGEEGEEPPVEVVEDYEDESEDYPPGEVAEDEEEEGERSWKRD